MSFNLAAFVRDMAREQGIPEVHISAVEERAARAKWAADRAGRYTPLKGGGGLIIVASMEGLEREVQSSIESSTRALGRRVVALAVEDHRRGVLERRVA